MDTRTSQRAKASLAARVQAALHLGQRGPVLWLLIVPTGLAAWLVPIALKRLIDGDEGYLLVAARLIGEGHWPYRDFFLPQTPMVPALFAAFFWVFGRSWLGARALAGLLAVAMGWLVYRETLSATRRQSAALFATALFALSGTTLGWLTIVKGFGLSALLLLAAVLLIGNVIRRAGAPAGGRRANLEAFATGVAMGLAASSRLYTLVVMPTLAIYLVAHLGLHRTSLRRLGALALGSVLGILPMIVCYALAGETFVFDTLLYHRVREYGQDSLLGSAAEKLPIFLKTVGLDAYAAYDERQWMGLALVATAALLMRMRWRSSPASAAVVVGPVLVAASVLPNPFLAQYLCLPVPFLAIEGGRLLGSLLELQLSRHRRLWSTLLALAAMVYLGYNAWVGWFDRQRFLYTGVGVPGVESTDRVPSWRIDTVEAVAKAVDARNIGVGASWWPGYFVGARTGIVLDLANDFGFRAAHTLPVADRRRLHVVTHEEVGEMIKQRRPRLFVEGNWATYPAAGGLPQYGYQLRTTVENARVWTVE